MALVNHIAEPVKHVADFASIGALVAVFFNWLPQITALLTACWIVMRMYEGWLSIKLRRLEAQIKRKELGD